MLQLQEERRMLQLQRRQDIEEGEAMAEFVKRRRVHAESSMMPNFCFSPTPRPCLHHAFGMMAVPPPPIFGSPMMAMPPPPTQPPRAYRPLSPGVYRHLPPGVYRHVSF